jgi:predicted NBD/HSP70 family sugar kinase
MFQKRTENIIDPSGGANQSRVRDYNERLILSLVRRHGSLAKSEIARRSALSAQTATVIMRALEKDGLLLRGEPQRGKVGQPSIPMRLNPEGVFSVGLNIGRRSADLTLVDFLGLERMALQRRYTYPTPEALLAFAKTGFGELSNSLPVEQRDRIAGIGISMPFELWNWAEKVDAPKSEMEAWRDFDFKSELASVCNLPTFLQNDATSACGAELVFGRGVELSDFVYFFIGTFIGGGIVLNHSVFSGRTGNAGALGSMPMIDRPGHSAQLIDQASVYKLEVMLQEAEIDCSPILLQSDDWTSFGEILDKWITTTAQYLAVAIASACSVIDFEAAIVDGGVPSNVRSRLVKETIIELEKLNLQGISEPRILEGVVGNGARALGGASLPLFARYLLDQNVLFKGIERR